MKFRGGRSLCDAQRDAQRPRELWTAWYGLSKLLGLGGVVISEVHSHGGI